MFLYGTTVPSGSGPSHYRVFKSHLDTTQSVGLPWTSDRRDAETSTWQHTTLKTD